MIDIFKDWVLQIAGTALIASAILTVTPESSAKKAVALVCGVALIISMLSIVSDFDYTAYSKVIAGYRDDMEDTLADIEETNKNLTRSIIEEKCAAYILDKGKTIGINEIRVSVTVRWDSESSLWYPVGAVIASNADDSQKEKLSAQIEADLGIAKDEQTWSAYDEQ